MNYNTNKPLMGWSLFTKALVFTNAVPSRIRIPNIISICFLSMVLVNVTAGTLSVGENNDGRALKRNMIFSDVSICGA